MRQLAVKHFSRRTTLSVPLKIMTRIYEADLCVK